MIILLGIYAVGDDDQALLRAGYVPLSQLSAIPNRCGHDSRDRVFTAEDIRRTR